jgi:hypothetical protein
VDRQPSAGWLGRGLQHWLQLAATGDALDAQVSTPQQLLEGLACRGRWRVSEQVPALDQAQN